MPTLNDDLKAHQESPSIVAAIAAAIEKGEAQAPEQLIEEIAAGLDDLGEESPQAG